MTDAPSLDRVTAVTAAMAALLDDDVRPEGDLEAVTVGRLVCERAGVVAGMPVAVQVFGRAGVRCRPAVDDGDLVGPADEVARLGGPAAAMRAAGRTAVRVLVRLSAIASGAVEPDRDDPIEAYAAEVASHARLSWPDALGHDGPTFRLEAERVT